MLVITFLVQHLDRFVLYSFTPMLFLPHVVLSAMMLRPLCSFILVTLSNLLYGSCLYVASASDGGVVDGLGRDAVVQMVGISALSFVIWYLTFRLARVINARDSRLSESRKDVQATFEISRSQMYHTAHQMKSPVVAIQAMLELYKFENVEGIDSEISNILNRIDVRCDYLLDSVSDMLFLAKVRAGDSVNWNVESIYLDCAVRRIIERHLDLLKKRSIQVVATTDSFQIMGDHDALDRMLDNLILNAINYSYAGGKVHIVGKETQNGYRLDVQDSGIGIRSTQLEEIFEPHYRTIEAKSHCNVSTGMGLPIVRAVAMFFGLTLSVRSRSGKGSCFSLDFPLATRLDGGE